MTQHTIEATAVDEILQQPSAVAEPLDDMNAPIAPFIAYGALAVATGGAAGGAALANL